MATTQISPIAQGWMVGGLVCTCEEVFKVVIWDSCSLIRELPTMEPVEPCLTGTLASNIFPVRGEIRQKYGDSSENGVRMHESHSTHSTTHIVLFIGEHGLRISPDAMGQPCKQLVGG
jgi:hypothetical protein